MNDFEKEQGADAHIGPKPTGRGSSRKGKRSIIETPGAMWASPPTNIYETFIHAIVLLFCLSLL